jgi:hypothetical protein
VRRTAISAALVVVLALLTAHPLGAGATAGQSRSRRRPPGPPAAPKAILVGLLDRKGVPDATNAGRVDGFVVNVAWAALQPTAGGAIAPGNAIDAAIAAIQGRTDLAGKRFKLRVMAGPQSPQWAKSLGGSPFSIQWDGATLSMPRFWTPEFGGAYAAFEAKLAARYDGAPEVAQVEVSRCTLTTAEPLLRGGSVPAVPQALVDAGYTAALDDTCQRDQLEAHDAWKQTRSGLALNPYQRVDGSGWVTSDEPYTETLMATCRSTLGARCVLENNSVRSPLQPDPYPQMYAAMARYASPIGFQTAAADRIGDEMQALQYAVNYGANSIELNRDYPNYDLTRLDAIRQRLHGTMPGPGDPGKPGKPVHHHHPGPAHTHTRNHRRT